MRFPRHALAAAALALAAGSAQASTFSNIFFFGDSLTDSGNNYLVFQNTPTFPAGSGLEGLNVLTPPRANAFITTPTPIASSQFIPSFPYAPASPYPFGTYSNGPTWAVGFGAAYGVAVTPSLAGGNNFAYGGAVTGGASPFPVSLTGQVQQYLDRPGPADPNALYVIAGGGNNARAVIDGAATLLANAAAIADPAARFAAQDLANIQIAFNIITAAQAYAADVVGMITQLAAAGADDFVVWNVPNVGLTPAVTGNGPQASGLATAVSAALNQALSIALAGLPGPIADDVRLFDVFGFVTEATSNPAAFGLTNTTQACAANPTTCDPTSWLFWDGIHPTTAGQALITQRMIALVPVPATLPLLAIALAGLALVVRRRR